MHHLIYPEKDTYITNRLPDENFGVDEILQVGTSNTTIDIISDTKDYVYVDQTFTNYGATSFTGTFTGSVMPGTSSFMGTLVGITACLTGTGTGVDTCNERTRTYAASQSIDRALLKFDLTAISSSIANGSIVNPSFHLKMKICNEYQLPIEYSVYAFPISQSWKMGNGYASDGGSDEGTNWIYRDYDGGTPWSSPGATYYQYPCTQSFCYKSADIDMDVSSIVNLWLNETIPNEGFLIISSDEAQPTGSGFMLKYFSEDTNTIYSPLLDVAWDDSQFITGSFFTGSIQITNVSGSSTIVQAGSSLIGAGGVHGNFKASAFLTTTPNFITASGFVFSNQIVQQFAGSFTGSLYGVGYVIGGNFSGSGIFTADYFSGSIDGTIVESTGSVSGNAINIILSGSISVPNYTGNFTASLLGLAIALNGSGSGYYYDTTYQAYTSFISGSGFTGNINGVPVIGPAYGLITSNFITVNLPNEITYLTATSPMESPYSTGLSNPANSPYAFIDLDYVWGGDEVGWSSLVPVPPNNSIPCSCGVSHSVQIMSGSFTGGPFSGSTFLAYYENYQIIFANLTGSWTSAALDGAIVNIPFPQASYPYVTAYVNGTYINGTALGIYMTSGSYSASFNGQFVDGPLMGGYARFQLSGSATTSSYAYTSSVVISSSFLNPMDVERPFSINLQNLQPEYKSGDIIKIGVFGRKKFPLKDFGISTQQVQYLVPEYLPSTSYYALKDNQTDEIVINFDDSTKISCTYPDGNYFFIDTTALPQERYYRVLIRVEDGVQIDTIDTGKTFKVTR